MQSPDLPTIDVPPSKRSDARPSRDVPLALVSVLAAIAAAALSATAGVSAAAAAGPGPAFTIELQQKIDGPSGSFTSSPLSAEGGQTVAYKILVKDSGNTPLIFAGLEGSGCDVGTISGGPGAGPVPPGLATSYLCQHVLSPADEQAGSYANTVSVTGGWGEPSPVLTLEVSNTVFVSLPKAPPSTPPAPPAPSAPQPQPVQHPVAPSLPAPLVTVGQASGPAHGRAVPGVARGARVERARRAHAQQQLHRARKGHRRKRT